MVQRRAYTNLGMLLSGLKWTEEAAACYCKAIALRPKHPETRKLLALAHCTLGEVDDATRVLKQWLEEEPGNPIARHMLAACTGKDVPERASNAFVEALLTVLRRASKRSSRGCRIARQRSWQPCWRIAAFNRRIVSTCWMQVVERALWRARRAFCAPAARRGPVRRHAGTCDGEERLPRAF